MSESVRLNAASIVGANGRVTAADLPTPDTQRWSIRRKAAVVAAVREGLMSLDEACSRYALHAHEFLSWEYCIGRYGLKGLRTTHTQFYLPGGEKRRDSNRRKQRR